MHKKQLLRNTLAAACLALLVCVSSALATPQSELLRQRLEAWQTSEFPAASGEPIHFLSTLQDFYEKREFKPIWLDPDQQRLSAQARALLNYLAGVETEGLLPSDYHVAALQQLATGIPVADPIQAELLLSDAFLMLSQHLLAGKVDPASLSSEWRANRRQQDLQPLLDNIVEGADIAQLLTSSQPRQVRYRRLIDILARLRQTPSPDWPELPVRPLLRPGDSDQRLPEIRRRLHFWNDLQEAGFDADFDHAYGPQLQAAVERFQQRHGLGADGIIGPATMEALNISPQQRARQVEVNLERWRWLAEDLGRKHVLVNIAGFELKVVDNGVTQLRMPVVVGRAYRKTPVFSDRIRYLVLNPTWTVPFKLAVQDKLPEIRQSPDYLRQMKFTVYDNRSGVVVDPDSVDWQAVGKNNFPYRLVQAPGPLNALGRIKFMFPNPFDVYLHDTPSRDLFAKPERALSSGCIRLGDPLALAEYLLREQGWDRSRLESALLQGETTTVFLKQPVPVHMEYWTAWVGRNGDLNFRKDIYNRDEPLWQALKTPVGQLQQPAPVLTTAGNAN